MIKYAKTWLFLYVSAKTYSMQLMKIMVVHVLRKYKLRTDMDIFKLRKRLVVTLVNMDGYHISFQER